MFTVLDSDSLRPSERIVSLISGVRDGCHVSTLREKLYVQAILVAIPFLHTTKREVLKRTSGLVLVLDPVAAVRQSDFKVSNPQVRGQPQ